MLSIMAEYGKVIQAGQRTVALVGTATVAGGTLVYTDADGDGFPVGDDCNDADSTVFRAVLPIWAADSSGLAPLIKLSKKLTA